MAQRWAVFTSLKAKKTAQTKPYKTTLHTTESEKATGPTGEFDHTLDSKAGSQTRVPSLEAENTDLCFTARVGAL